VTHRAIDRATLVHVLNMRGMLTKIVGNNSDEKWTGTVLAMQDAIIASGDAAAINGIRLWLSHITNPTNVTWDTRLPELAAAFWQLRSVFADKPGMPTSADVAALADLGGGWQFATLTEAEYTAQREEAVQSAAKRGALNAVQAAVEAASAEYRKADSTPATIIAAAADYLAGVGQ